MTTLGFFAAYRMIESAVSSPIPCTLRTCSLIASTGSADRSSRFTGDEPDEVTSLDLLHWAGLCQIEYLLEEPVYRGHDADRSVAPGVRSLEKALLSSEMPPPSSDSSSVPFGLPIPVRQIGKMARNQIC